MYKAIALTLVVTSVFLTSCANDQENLTIEETSMPVEGSDTFENSDFSIVLPGAYIADNAMIEAKNKQDFSTILFSSSEETEVGDLEVFIEESFQTFWEQTDRSGEFMDTETATIGGKDALKFTIQYSGRGYSDSDGYLNEYHYAVMNGESLVQFWTSASDLDSPEAVSREFDEIMETVSLK